MICLLTILPAAPLVLLGFALVFSSHSIFRRRDLPRKNRVQIEK
jgi:hypothetical protein